MRRMRQYIITVLSIVVCSVVGLTLSACDDSASSGANSGAIAIIASNRSNQQRFNLLSSEHIISAIDDHMGGTFYVISADGVPRLVVSIDSSSTRQDDTDKEDYEVSVLEAMLTPAEKPESDMLSALSLAASSLAHASGDRTILVVDSGVSTAGAMAFQNTGLLEPHADVDAMIERMRSAGTLPDLTGVTVRWFGLGSVEEPQPLLDTAAKNRLKNLWTKLITAANGEVVFDDAPMMKVTGEDLPAVPEVTPVPVGAFELGAAPSLEMSLPDTEVGFEADVDVLRNEEVAKSRIQEAAAQIRSSGVSEVRVTGCTSSWGTAEHRQDLSERRAEVVAGLLENNGVKVTSITGRGYDCPHQVVDTNADGTPIEELMAVNRRVIIQAP
jgi:ompA